METNEKKQIAFFDTDNITSFFCVGKRNLLFEIFDTITLPDKVVEELLDERCPVHTEVENLFKWYDKSKVRVAGIQLGTKEYNIYRELTRENGSVHIGKGEASCIALAASVNSETEIGIVCSSNHKDIDKYLEKYKLEHMDVGDILSQLLSRGGLTMEECENIWADMKSKGRWLPKVSFKDYLKGK